jgi:hypothetical protein
MAGIGGSDSDLRLNFEESRDVTVRRIGGTVAGFAGDECGKEWMPA